MTDVLYRVRDELSESSEGAADGLEHGSYYVSTIHRPSNTDDPDRLAELVRQLAGLDRPVLLLAHPRLVHLAERFGVSLDQGSLRSSPPLPYPQLIAAVSDSAGVITDSGGLQKEAFLLRVPCTTVRADTEWVETVELGWNVLVGGDITQLAASATRPAPEPTDATPYGDGHAAERVIDALLEWASPTLRT